MGSGPQVPDLTCFMDKWNARIDKHKWYEQVLRRRRLFP
jgi:hypothetical protein